MTTRPRVVTVACWLLAGGAALLFAGGLFAALLHFETIRASAAPSITDGQVRQALTFHRGAGLVCAVAALGLGFLALATRGGDPRFRRATVALALAVVVLVGLVGAFVGAHLFSLLSMLPIIVGLLMLRRPAATSWFHPEPELLDD